MHAVIFDIDGTLLDSDAVDAELYMASIRHVLGAVRIRDGWGAYENVTDSGILTSILSDNGIKQDGRVVEAIRSHFLRAVRHRIETKGPFPEVPGARAFVEDLRAAPDHAFAYATGGWQDTAVLKLTSAGFPLQGVPLLTSDDSTDRCEIMRLALRALGSRFDTVSYYGDGEWDRDAALRLCWDFVPVGGKLGGITNYATREFLSGG